MLHKKLSVLLIAIALIGMLGGCEQIATKEFGGNMTIDLPKNEKLVNATWKDSNFWYLTRPMRQNEQPETYIFREQSTLGIAQGSVTLIESR